MLGQASMTDKIADHTLALLRYHEAHPELNNRQLGELFGITRQRVSQIIKRDKRDRMVAEYFRTHPGASLADVMAMFDIRSSRRVRTLMPIMTEVETD